MITIKRQSSPALELSFTCTVPMCPRLMRKKLKGFFEEYKGALGGVILVLLIEFLLIGFHVID
jgi:hypothetical protein